MHAGPHNIPDDEIDFTSVGERIKTAAAYPFILWRSNVKTTLTFLLAAILLAIALKYIVPRTYRSSFIIRPNDRTEKFHLKMLGDLQLLLKNQDYNTIANELKISSGSSKTIRDLRVANPYIKNRTDSVNYTEVTLELTDYNQFINIQTGLLNYLESNPYFKKIRQLQEKLVRQSLDLVESDLDRLEQLKKLQADNYNKPTVGGNTLLLNDLINPMTTYSMAVERMNKKASLQSQLVFIDNFQLIKSCIIVRHHIWPPRILITSLVLIPLFLLLSFIFLHINRVRKRTDVTVR